jgi:hypothetical protein
MVGGMLESANERQDRSFLCGCNLVFSTLHDDDDDDDDDDDARF